MDTNFLPDTRFEQLESKIQPYPDFSRWDLCSSMNGIKLKHTVLITTCLHLPTFVAGIWQMLPTKTVGGLSIKTRCCWLSTVC